MKARAPRDCYFTPPDCARAIVERLHQVLAGANARIILEPSAGKGAFVRAALERWPTSTVIAVDLVIRPELRSSGAVLQHGDFLAAKWKRYPLIIGNPPYNAAELHIEHALRSLAPGGHLAFLLRLGMLASLKRARGLWAKPGLYYLAPIAPRPKFRWNKSDNSDYALFVWRRGFEGDWRGGRPIVWRDSTELDQDEGEEEEGVA